jgi:hypothetical protein
MHKLEKYVGRGVRLKKQVFQKIASRAKHPDDRLENFFLVAAINREMHKLICYGSNLRIMVDATEVVLV